MTDNDNANLIRVVFLPYGEGNPYLQLLSGGCGRHGAVIRNPRVGLFFARSILVDQAPEILHLHWLHVFYLSRHGPVALIKAILFTLQLAWLRARGMRLVWTVHNLAAHEAFHPWIDRYCTKWVAQHSDAIITHCNWAKDRLLALTHASQERVNVIPLGHFGEFYPNTTSRAEARRNLKIPESGFVFLSFGMIRQYKGIPELIDAFRQLDACDAYLVIAGRCADSLMAATIAGDVDGDERIVFTNRFIPDDEVQIFMNVADVAVFPYLRVTTSASLVLAMSFGLPCIASATGCIPETLSKRGGWLFDPNRPDGLRNAMRQALDQRASVAEIGRGNHDRAAQWSWDEIGRATVAVYAAVRTDHAAR